MRRDSDGYDPQEDCLHITVECQIITKTMMLGTMTTRMESDRWHSGALQWRHKDAAWWWLKQLFVASFYGLCWLRCRMAGMVHSDSGWTRGVQVKLWDPLRTRAIPERLRGAFTTRRYTNPCLPLPLPLRGKRKILILQCLYVIWILLRLACNSVSSFHRTAVVPERERERESSREMLVPEHHPIRQMPEQTGRDGERDPDHGVLYNSMPGHASN